MDIGKERPVFFADQPELPGAGPVRKRARLEFERVHHRQADERGGRQRRGGNLERPPAGQCQQAGACRQAQERDEDDARLPGPGRQPFSRSRMAR